jgi:hypothetical protein
MVRFMRPRRSVRAMMAGAVGAVSLLGSTAHAADPTQQELMDELKALRAKVERLEAAQAQQEKKPDPAEVRQTIDDVLRDADRRSQLLQATGFTAGYNKNRFIIQSEDGNFSLSPTIQFQLRYATNYREEDADNAIDGDATSEHGFEVRRLKLAFEGNVFSPDTKYKFQWATNRNGGGLALDDGFIIHKLNFAPDFQIRAGQFKDITFHEEITSSKRQLAVDRSLANEVLAGGQTDFIQGIGLIWDDGAEGLPLRAEAGYTDGPNSDNTNFVDGGGSPFFGAADPDFGLYGRVEYLARGPWKYYEDFTTMGNVEDVLVFGAGAFYTQAGDSDVIFHTFDAQYEMNRLALYGAYYGVFSDGVEDTSYDVGGVAQAGYMLDEKNKWEVFGRYSLVSLDTGGADSDDDFQEFTTGVNYYMHKHAAKVTVDVSYLPNGIPINLDGNNELDPDADDDQLVLRGQFQLVL